MRFKVASLVLFVMCLFSQMFATAKVTPRYAYVADPGLGQILEYSISTTNGALKPITGCLSTPDAGAPSAAIVDKDGSFLYVANEGTSNIFVYPINPSTGCLGTPVSYPTKGTGPVALDLAAHDQILFASDNGSSQIDAFSLNSGVLTPISGSPFTGCPNGAGIVVDVVQSYLYQASNVSSNGSDSGTGTVCAFEFSLSGKLWMSAAIPYTTTGAYPTRVAFDTVGQLLFVTNSGANTVESFSVSATGVLTAINTINTGTGPAGVAVNPFGQMVFVSNAGGSSTSTFLLSSAGALEANGATVTSTDGEPTAIAVDQTGRYLYVTESSGYIYGYTIAPATGKLTVIAGSPLSTGTGSDPVAIATQP